jgi:hypothetical protein
MWGFETLLGKRGVYMLLHKKRKKWYSMVKALNLGTEMKIGVEREADASYVCRRTANHIYC